MKQVYRILLTLLLLLSVTKQRADDTTFTAANLTVTWSQTDKSFTICGTLADGVAKDLIVRSKPQATYTNQAGVASGNLTPDSYQQVNYEARFVQDEFGTGTEHVFTFSNPTTDNGDDVVMQQSFFAYDGPPFILTRLSLISHSGVISSNNRSPISSYSNKT